MTKKLLDLGCGTGEQANYLQAKNPAAEVVGVDISPDNVSVCERNKVSVKQTFRVSKAESLPFDSHSFDEVHCYEVLEHVTDLDRSLQEIRRVLKPTGRLLLSVPLEESERILASLNDGYLDQIGHKRTFSPATLKGKLTQQGFIIEHYRGYNSIEHIFWAYVFKRGGKIRSQTAELTIPPPFFLRVLRFFLSRDLLSLRFATGNLPYKLVALVGWPLWLCGRLLDRFALHKRQGVICKLG